MWFPCIVICGFYCCTIFAFLWKCRLLYFCASYFPSIFYSFSSFHLCLPPFLLRIRFYLCSTKHHWWTGWPESHWERMSCVWSYWKIATARWLQTVRLLCFNLYLPTVGWQRPTYAYSSQEFTEEVSSATNLWHEVILHIHRSCSSQGRVKLW